ncbi:unnamed protein product [Tilletia laevis]|nr:hypothetical protein CF335_g8601 [Tilletia laevis]CAD6900267.1 unnamed protein product [Tilletia laevis]
MGLPPAPNTPTLTSTTQLTEPGPPRLRLPQADELLTRLDIQVGASVHRPKQEKVEDVLHLQETGRIELRGLHFELLRRDQSLLTDDFIVKTSGVVTGDEESGGVEELQQSSQRNNSIPN